MPLTNPIGNAHPHIQIDTLKATASTSGPLAIIAKADQTTADELKNLGKNLTLVSAADELAACKSLCKYIPEGQVEIDKIDSYFTKLRNGKLNGDLTGPDIALSNLLSDKIYRPLTDLVRTEFPNTNLAKTLEEKIKSSNQTGTARILMGLPGSGKSSSLEQIINPASDEILFDDDEFKKALLSHLYEKTENGTCRADAIKHQLIDPVSAIITAANPHYTAAQLKHDMDTWLVRLIHPAIQTIASEKRTECMAAGKSFILHHVFAHMPTFERELERIQTAGYNRTQVIYVDTEAAEAIRRGLIRSKKTGREVLSNYTTYLAETMAKAENGENLSTLQKRSVHPKLNFFTLLAQQKNQLSVSPAHQTECIYIYNGKGIAEGESPLYVSKNSFRPADVAHTQALERADQMVAQNAPAAQNCTFYPAIHLAPKAAWMSDPNAPVFYKDEWHMFYQHAPEYDNNGLKGNMHWGHATSKDLIHWHHQPIALAPSEGFDKDGCFSGNAVVVDGKLALLLTGNIFIDREKDIVKEAQYLVMSTDGVHFAKHPGNPVIPAPPEGYCGHFRDPFIFKVNNQNYMLLASRVEQNAAAHKNGSLQLYKQGDTIAKWEHIGPVIDSNTLKLDAYMLECPSLVNIGDKMVLSCSPQGVSKDGAHYQNFFSTGCSIGTLDEKTGQFKPENAIPFHEFDHGHDHYATLLFPDTANNRTLLIPWMGNWGTQIGPDHTHGDNWAGMMGLIREVTLNDGQVITMPIPEYERLRQNEISVNDLKLTGNQNINLKPVTGEVIEVLADITFDPALDGTFGLKFRCSPDGKEETTLVLDPQKSQVTLDRSRSGAPIEISDPRVPKDDLNGQQMASNIRSGSLDMSKGTVTLRVIVDRSSIEAFLEDGRLAFSSRIFPGAESLGVTAFTTGNQSATITSLKKYDLTDVNTPDRTTAPPQTTQTDPVEQTHLDALEKASQAVALAAPEVADCPHRPLFGLMPTAGWMSDPVGLLFANGTYHVGYEFGPHMVKRPDGTVDKGDMHWGLKTSTDLIHWQDHGAVLAPGTRPEDRDGIFSGSTIHRNGQFIAFYTGNIFEDRPRDIVKEGICMATSPDGIHYSKSAENPILTPPNGFSGHFRDPYVFEKNGTLFMVISARVSREDNNGKLLLYGADTSDTRNWTYKGELIDSAALGLTSYMLECPSLIELNQKTALIISPQGTPRSGTDFQNINQCCYVLGEFDSKTGCFKPELRPAELDKGFDFYAAQTMADPKHNRQLLIGWMGMWNSEIHTDKWKGCLTIPRELTLSQDGNRILSNPIRELTQLRGNHLSLEPVQINSAGTASQEIKLNKAFNDAAFDLTSEFKFAPDAGQFGIKLRCSEDGKEETEIRFDVQKNTVTLDRSKSGKPILKPDPRPGETAVEIRMAQVDLSNGTVKVRIISDRSSIELFINDGETAISARLYPDIDSTGIKLFANHTDLKVASFEKYTLTDVNHSQFKKLSADLRQ